MSVFAPFRVLGLVCADGVAPDVQQRGRQAFVTVSAGRSFQIYNAAKLGLIFVGQQLEHRITALASNGDFTFAAYGADVAVFKRAHRVGTWRGAAGCGPVVALLSLGEVVLSLAAGGVLTTWSPGNLEAPLRSCRLPAGFEPTCLCHPDAYLNKVLVGAADGRLALLNFATSRLVHVFAGVPAGSGDGADGRRQPGVTCLAAAPALDTVGVGLSDGRWALLNVAYDATLAVFTHGDGGCGGGDEGGEGSAVTALAFRTGAGPPQAVAGGAGGALSVWDLEARRLAAVVPGAHDARVLSLHFFVGQPLLQSAGGDNRLRQWLFDGGGAPGGPSEGPPRLLRQRCGHARAALLVRFHGDAGGGGAGGGGAAASCAGDDGAASPLLVAGADRTLRLFSVVKDAASRELSQGGAASERAAKRLRLAGPTDGGGGAAEALRLPPITALASCPLRGADWASAVTAHAGLGHARTWHVDDGRAGRHSLAPPRCAPGVPVTAVALSACGHYAFTGAEDGQVDRFNMQSGLHRGGFTRARPAASAAAAAAAVPGPADGGGADAGDAAAAAAAAVAAAAPVRGSAPRRAGAAPSLWAAAGPKKGREHGPRPAHDGAATFVAPDGANSALLTAGRDGRLRLWAFGSRRLRGGCASGGGAVSRGALHRGARLAALACADGSARVFDVAPCPPVRVRTFSAPPPGATDGATNGDGATPSATRHGDAVTDLCWSPDARWLLTACLDGGLRVWDVPGGGLLQALRLGGAPVTSLALSPDGATLATTHAGSRGVRLWANRAVYSALGEAGLAPPQRPGEPLLPVRAPAPADGVGGGAAAAAAGRGVWGGRGDGDDSDDDHGFGGDGAAEGGEAGGAAWPGGGGDGGGGDAPPAAAAAAAAPALPPPPAQVAPRWATLAGVPRARWAALLHADALRERGRVERPAAASAPAPFSLPTRPGLAAQPVFDTSAAAAVPGADAAEAGGGGARASRVLVSSGRRGGGGAAAAAGCGAAAARSPLLRAALRSDPPAFLAHLCAAGPSALDAEIRGLAFTGGGGFGFGGTAPPVVGADDEANLLALLSTFEAVLTGGTHYEVAHAALAVVLRSHGEALGGGGGPRLRAAAARVLDAAAAGWARLDAKFQEARCALALVAGLGAA